MCCVVLVWYCSDTLDTQRERSIGLHHASGWHFCSPLIKKQPALHKEQYKGQVEEQNQNHHLRGPLKKTYEGQLCQLSPEMLSMWRASRSYPQLVCFRWARLFLGNGSSKITFVFPLTPSNGTLVFHRPRLESELDSKVGDERCIIGYRQALKLRSTLADPFASHQYQIPSSST